MRNPRSAPGAPGVRMQPRREAWGWAGLRPHSLLSVCLSVCAARCLSEAAPTVPTTPPVADEGTALVDWLTLYGYLPPPDPATGHLQTWEAVTQAVKAMQRFAGLPETGVIDEETLTLMSTPRCSLPDDQGEPQPTPQSSTFSQHAQQHPQRQRRDTAEWTKSHKNISWRVRSYPSHSSLSREMIRSLLFYALRVWAEPTPLEFHEVGVTGEAELQVDFLQGSHGDSFPFDGPGGAVGHAFFPSDPQRAGTVHLDSQEDWTFRASESQGTDLFTVAVHEFGHALGLSHSSARRSIMRPYYQGPVGDPLQYQLSPEDRREILRLYGKREHLLSSESPSLVIPTALTRPPLHRHTARPPGPLPDRCSSEFDAVASIRGETFFFKGRYFWRVSQGGHLLSLRPVLLQRFWRGLPAGLESVRAVLERASDHSIIFIAGSQYWLFKDLSLIEGFPRPLSELSVQGDLQWDPQAGRVVWGEWEEAMGDPSWKELIEGGVDGITTDGDGYTYVFKGHLYWRFPSPGSYPEPGYPRSTAYDWLDCPDPSLTQPSIGPSSLAPPRGRQEYRECLRSLGCPCITKSRGSTVTAHLGLSSLGLLIMALVPL
ncbi:matrix metalloproteinase-17b isoform X2 [Lepisosteus oculatus]